MLHNPCMPDIKPSKYYCVSLEIHNPNCRFFDVHQINTTRYVELNEKWCASKVSYLISSDDYDYISSSMRDCMDECQYDYNATTPCVNIKEGDRSQATIPQTEAQIIASLKNCTGRFVKPFEPCKCGAFDLIIDSYRVRFADFIFKLDEWVTIPEYVLQAQSTQYNNCTCGNKIKLDYFFSNSCAALTKETCTIPGGPCGNHPNEHAKIHSPLPLP